jgi:hypothetical protein
MDVTSSSVFEERNLSRTDDETFLREPDVEATFIKRPEGLRSGTKVWHALSVL